MEKNNKIINMWITMLSILIVCLLLCFIVLIIYNQKSTYDDKINGDNENSVNVNDNIPYEFDEFYFIIGRLDENGPADFYVDYAKNYKYIKGEGIYINNIKLNNTENNDSIVSISDLIIAVINKYDDGETYRFFDNKGNEISIVNNNSDIHYRFITYDKETKHVAAYYKCNDRNNLSCKTYQKNEFLIYNNRVVINQVNNDILDMDYIEKININKSKEENIIINGLDVNLRYDSENNSIFVNDKEYQGFDTVIHYTNNLIILREKEYGAYQYRFLKVNGDEIDRADMSSVYPLPYRYKNMYIKDNNLYITSICISKECYTNNDFKPVELEVNYNGQKIYIIDAK